MLDRVATGRTVLLSSHQISEVERVADRVAILHAGQLSIHESLQELRDSVSEVIVSLDDPLLALPQLDGPAMLLSEQTEGRQRRMIVRHFADEMRMALEARPGVSSVSVRPATLDDIFVACIRGNGSPDRLSQISDAELGRKSEETVA